MVDPPPSVTRDPAAPSAAFFLPGHAANTRLALELITHPALLYAPEVDDDPQFDALLEQAAIGLVTLARTAQSFAIQRRLMEDVGVLSIDIPCRRLQVACGEIVRRLLTAMGTLTRRPTPWFERVVEAADEAIVRALTSPLDPVDALPDEVAAALAAVLSLDLRKRRRADDLLVLAAGLTLALFVLAGVPNRRRREPTGA